MASLTPISVTVVLDLAALGIDDAVFSQASGPIDMRLNQLTIRGSMRVGAAVVAGGGSAPPATVTAAPSTMPSITVERHPVDMLQVGNQATAAYFIEDNRWGAATIAEGAGSSQYAQAVGRQLSVGALGEVAWRTTWRWPQFVNGQDVEAGGFPEVKAYPAVIYGRKPGIFGTDRWPAFSYAVRLPDGLQASIPPFTPGNIAADWQSAGGSVSTLAPSGHTPGTNLPRQLPLSAGIMLTTGVYSISAAGKGHIAFDIWLQDPVEPNQIHGFGASPITHEIMIPLKNWGNYGNHNGGRNPSWYDHDVTIDGVLYHVYCAKNEGRNEDTGVFDGSARAGLRYNFAGSLNGSYTNEETGNGRTGWKFIVFQHDGTAHPLQSDGTFRIDTAKFLTHLSTKTDSRGIGFIRNTEYVVSSELGVEMVYGSGDLTVWDYRVVV